MNIFIAQKMTGLTDEEVDKRRDEIMEACKTKFGDDVNFLDQFHLPNDVPEDVTSDTGIGLYLLGRSLQVMAKADVVVIDAKSLSSSKGTQSELKICQVYDIPCYWCLCIDPVRIVPANINGRNMEEN